MGVLAARISQEVGKTESQESSQEASQKSSQEVGIPPQEIATCLAQ
jgi:hypothetical protein